MLPYWLFKKYADQLPPDQREKLYFALVVTLAVAVTLTTIAYFAGWIPSVVGVTPTPAP